MEELQKGKMEVKTQVNVTDFRLKDFMAMKIAEIDFNIFVGTIPKIGYVDVSGKAYYHSFSIENDITKTDEGKVKLNPQASEEIYKSLLLAPMIDIINISRMLGLPMPVAFPRVEVSKPVTSIMQDLPLTPKKRGPTPPKPRND